MTIKGLKLDLNINTILTLLFLSFKVWKNKYRPGIK